MIKRFAVVGLAMAGALLAGTALAQGPGGGMGMGMGPGFGDHQPPMERAFGFDGGHGRWWNRPKVIERLKLTDEQRKEFDAILLAHREKLIDLRANVQKAELELEPLVSADQPDEPRILSQIDRVAQARAELEKANARFLLAIRDKLTPEQWKQVQAFRASRGQDRHDWRDSGQDPDDQYHHRQGPPAPPSQPAPPSAEPQAPAAPQSGAGQ